LFFTVQTRSQVTSTVSAATRRNSLRSRRYVVASSGGISLPLPTHCGGTASAGEDARSGAALAAAAAASLKLACALHHDLIHWAAGPSVALDFRRAHAPRRVLLEKAAKQIAAALRQARRQSGRLAADLGPELGLGATLRKGR